MNIKLTNEFLHQLVDNTNSRKAVVFSKEGLSMFSTLDDNNQDEVISAHSATMFDFCESSMNQMGSSSIDQLILENDNAYTVIRPINVTSFLVLFTDINPDLVLIKARMQATVYLMTLSKEELELV